jgi:hypothetical protein
MHGVLVCILISKQDNGLTMYELLTVVVWPCRRG